MRVASKNQNQDSNLLALKTAIKQSANLFNQKKPEQALKIARKALEKYPDNIRLLNNAGGFALTIGDFKTAESFLKKALKIKPDYVDAHYNLGTLFKAQNQFSKAKESYLRVIEIRPDYVAAHNNLGNIFLEQKQFDKAKESYLRAIEIKSDYAEVHNSLGIIFKEQNQLEKAKESYLRAIKIKSDYYGAYNNLGNLFFKQQQFTKAKEYYLRAIEIRSDYAEPHNSLGNIFLEQKKFTKAKEFYLRAIEISPDYVAAHNNLGNIFLAQKQFVKAKESYLRALDIRSDYAVAHNNLGNLFLEQKQLNKAKASYYQVVKIQPANWYALIRYIHQSDVMNSWDIPKDISKAFNNYLRKLKANEIKVSLSPATFPLLAITEDPYIHKLSALIYGQRFSEKTTRHLDISKNPLKIKIAYLSAHFRKHVVAYLTAELFELHDKKQFEIYAFSYGMKNEQTKIRKRLEVSFDKFIDVSNVSDDEIAALIQGYGIHIVIDLDGYIGEARIGILASRPAPIQVQYLGYPGTLGLSYIDYMIADKIVIPKEQREHYTEKILFLPDTYQPSDRKRKIDPIIPDPIQAGLPKDKFVFSSFNNSFKIRKEQFDIWCDILKIVPGSVLWLFESNQWASENLKKEIQKCDIDPARLIFAPRVPTLEQHLSRTRLSDLFLDTYPFNAGATANDCLWSGVPILTKIGKSYVSRMAASLLYAIGLPELVTKTDEEYKEMAVMLARDPNRLKSIKAKLARNIKTKPLFDTIKYTKNLEAGYLEMWKRYSKKEKPADIYLDKSKRKRKV